MATVKICGKVVTMGLTVIVGIFFITVILLSTLEIFPSPGQALAADPETVRLEMEKLKLEQEKLKFEEKKLTLEQEREWWKVLANILTVLVTVGIGTYGVTRINKVYQDKQLKREQVLKKAELELQKEKTRAELELQKEKAKAEIELQKEKADADRQQAEMKYLGDYLKYALEDDVERRIRFAEYFTTLTISPDLQKKWEAYHKIAVDLKDNLQKIDEEIAVKQKAGKLKEAEELEKKRARLQAQAAPLPEKPRSTEEMLSEGQKLFGLDKGLRPLQYIENDFEVRGEVVEDHKTGLMWQKSGSKERLTYEQAKKYVEDLNRQRFAGYDDWRLPTTRELLTLVEEEKQSNKLFINPIFDVTQDICWSADRRSSESVWYVRFNFGSVYWLYLDRGGYVRAVRP